MHNYDADHHPLLGEIEVCHSVHADFIPRSLPDSITDTKPGGLHHELMVACLCRDGLPCGGVY